MTPSPISTIDDYIGLFSPDIQKILQQVRNAVKQAAPEAVEKISYQMPAFALHGNLVYFAAFKNHIGFYALPTGNKAFQHEISLYKTGKGSIQFPLNEPMPIALIKKIVAFRVKENEMKIAAKKKK